MKKLHNSGLPVLLLCALAIPLQSFAATYCTKEDRGSPHVDAKSGPGHTNYVARAQANKPWQDWIWRGDWEGAGRRCPTNASSDCKYNWGQTKTTGTSTTHGLNIAFSGAVGRSNNNLMHGVAEAGYNAQWSRWNQVSNSFNYEVSHARGTYIEPIVVQNRRWKKGNMQGGWVFSHRAPIIKTNQQLYCYNWQGLRYGEWTANMAEGTQYGTFNIHR